MEKVVVTNAIYKAMWNDHCVLVVRKTSNKCIHIHIRNFLKKYYLSLLLITTLHFLAWNAIFNKQIRVKQELWYSYGKLMETLCIIQIVH